MVVVVQVRIQLESSSSLNFDSSIACVCAPVEQEHACTELRRIVTTVATAIERSASLIAAGIVGSVDANGPPSYDGRLLKGAWRLPGTLSLCKKGHHAC